MSLKEELQDVIEGETEDSPEVLEENSTDASIFKITPKVVVFPKHAEDIKNLVRFASKKKEQGGDISLTPRSGGTCMSGGTLTESIVVDVNRHMNNIISVEREPAEHAGFHNRKSDGTATVQPGMYYRNFEKETLKKNLLMPSYPASREICTVGGMTANNSGGEKTLRYGKTEEYIAKLKVVLADGEEYIIRPLNKKELQSKLAQDDFEGEFYRNIHSLVEEHSEQLKDAKPKVSKNSSGYYLWNIWDENREVFDLTQLFVGSQGTLGIITEITFRLITPEKHSQLLVIFMRHTDNLAELVNEVLKYQPESLESYDDKTLWLVFKYIGSFLKLLGVKNIFKMAWSFLPELKMILTGGFPRLIMLAEFTGDTEQEVKEAAENTKEAIKDFSGVVTHVAKNNFETEKYWTIRREAFNLIRHHLKGEKSEPFIDDVIVRPEKLPEFLPKLYNILEPYKQDMTYAIGGHSGDGNMHIYSIMDPNNPRFETIIKEVSEKVYSLVVSLDGSITAEHNDGLIRSPYVKKMFGEKVYQLFEAVKYSADKSNIFNPGKKVNSDLQYSLDHLNRGT